MNTWKDFFIAILLILPIFAACRTVLNLLIIPVKEGFTQARVLKNGVGANADIVSVQQTNEWGGNKPVCNITVRFMTLDGKEYEASVKKALDINEVERFKAGNGTTIKYDPENPNKIAIYDKPLFL
ncbi:DUF3592 domain-containing protein [Affinibrenneria salicis]|uniref:DUF3592 domain-containing protein n=1 Tax=Affinibrenneria salicis TaxID=2590031 RepID=A0A5J5G686_9GAMM|nr:DUF3592 domain-containing protein [Affinibrenneria salicis]KAA9002641.1 DUF3592 domain-containing protein [Affinibrenneria salicis]KAA9003071.1 DUF3592 domain-containing protein [Affinibrenneria salicis]